LQDLDSNRFAVADLHGKLANLFADLKSTKLTETGHFKIIASGDPISGEKKFKDAFGFSRSRAAAIPTLIIITSDDLLRVCMR
jgi:phage/plasmid-associated DNA primase